MPAYLAPDPIQSTQLIPGSNTPAAGALLFSYSVGSSTKQNTYTDPTASTARTNPIVLDSGGSIPGNGEVWIASTTKFVLAPFNDTDPPASPYWSRDNYSGVNDPSQSGGEWIASGLTPTFVNGSTFTFTGDQTPIFTSGRRLRTINTSGTLYSTIASSVFATSTSTLVIQSDAAGIDSGLSSISYGVINPNHDSLPNVVSIKRFGVKGDGVTDDTTALAAVRTYLAGLTDPVKIIWPAGIYVYSVSPNWAIAHSMHEAIGKVELSYTGSSNALIFDGGAVGVGVTNVKFLGNFVVKGTASATNAFFARALHHSRLEGTVLGAGTTSAGLLTNWCVLTDFAIKVTSNEGAWVSQPANGYLIDQRAAGEYTASCNFWNPIVENVSGTGIKIANGSGNNFFGGTSEANNRGVEIATGSNNLTNKFFGLDTEGNAVEDYLLNCFDHTFYGCKASGLVHLINLSVDNRFIGGYLNSVTVDANAQNNSFIGLTMGNAGGTFTDNGIKTALVDVRDATAGLFRTNILGTQTNDLAPTSFVGEYISAATASTAAIALTTATTATVTSTVLTAGDWDVTGVVDFMFAVGTNYTNLKYGVGTSSAFVGQDTFGDYETSGIVPTNARDMAWSVPTSRISASTTITAFLLAEAVFTASTTKAYGTIRARRVR